MPTPSPFAPEDHRLEAMPDDALYARKVAGRYGIRLHEIQIAPDIVETLPRMVGILDEPIGDPAAINTLLMCEAARRRRGEGDSLRHGRRRALRRLSQASCLRRSCPLPPPPWSAARGSRPARSTGFRWPLRAAASDYVPLGQAVPDVLRTSRRSRLPPQLHPLRPAASWPTSSIRSSVRTWMIVLGEHLEIYDDNALPIMSIACASPTLASFSPVSTSPTPTGPAWPPPPRFGCHSSIRWCSRPPFPWPATRRSGAGRKGGAQGSRAGLAPGGDRRTARRRPSPLPCGPGSLTISGR